MLEPLGGVRDGTVELLRDVMLTQQRYLVDRGLMRHLQGFDVLSSLGDTLGKVPVLNKLVHASSNVPPRVGWSAIRRMGASELDTFERDDLAALRELEQRQAAELARVQVLVAGARGETAGGILRELRDGIEINLLRTRQVRAALGGFVAARRVQLGDASRRAVVQAAVASVGDARRAAEIVIRRREAAYRESPEDAWAGHRLSNGAVGTMWGRRSLTPAHTLKYWDATIDEARRAAESIRTN